MVILKAPERGCLYFLRICFFFTNEDLQISGVSARDPDGGNGNDQPISGLYSTLAYNRTI